LGVGERLGVVADDTAFDELVELVRDKRYGKAREMLAVALGNMKDRRAVAVLVDLLGDDEIAGHAVTGLGKLEASEARVHLEAMARHPTEWIREEAKKALKGMGTGLS
jgi:HEAT repeat protein